MNKIFNNGEDVRRSIKFKQVIQYQLVSLTLSVQMDEVLVAFPRLLQFINFPDHEKSTKNKSDFLWKKSAAVKSTS